MAGLSTSVTRQFTLVHVRLLILEGCSIYRLVKGGFEVPFVLAYRFAFLHKVGSGMTLSFLNSVLSPSLLLNIKGCYQIFN